MYVCICNPTTENEIIECCKDGCTLKELTQHLDVCSNCRTCSKELSKLFKEHSPRMSHRKNSGL